MDERGRRRLWLFTLPLWLPIFTVGELCGIVAGIFWKGARCGCKIVQLIVDALPTFEDET